MASFDRPGMYMPFLARCNPHVESARANAKAWAVEVGMLHTPAEEDAAGVWDENKFDDMDVALFAALLYPDASSQELDLLAEWHIWIFYYDDRFLRIYKRAGDLAGAKEHVDLLLSYLSSTPDQAVPAPTNPVETGLADLWPRTVSTMSETWRARFAELTKDMLEEPLREVVNLRADHVPDPISYVQIRRKTGGALWGAILIEHAMGIELPPDVQGTRVMRVLNDTFADGVHLRNDILSYEKELLAGETNGVMVVERFLDCDPQRAADLVNELATSRMQQFENTGIVELPLMFAEHGPPLEVCLNVFRYLKGLEACMAGDLEWEETTGRYNQNEPADSASEERRGAGPFELRTTVARLGLARRAAAVAPQPGAVLPDPDVSHVEVPRFYMPFTGGYNPHLDTAYKHVRDWARDRGMLGSGVPGWDESSFESANPVRYSALVFPEAQEAGFELAAKWVTTTYFLGDLMDLFERRRDLAGAKATLDRLPAFMPISRPSDVPSPTNPLEHGIADLWPRIAPVMSEDWRRWLHESLVRTCDGVLWKFLNVIQNRVPDPVDYTEMRRGSGVEMDLALLYYAMDLAMPSQAPVRELMRTLIVTILDWRMLINDIVSFEREIEVDGGINNGVQIMRRFLGGDVGEAVARTNDLATAQVKNFERVSTVDLPQIAAGLASGDRQHVDRTIDALRKFLAGELEAHLVVASSRYGHAGGEETRPEPTPWRLVPWPTGLGTSAARIGSVVGTDARGPAKSAPSRVPLGPTGLGATSSRVRP